MPSVWCLRGVVFAEERAQTLVKFGHRFVTTDIDVVILHCAPQPFNHDVVQSPSFAIHADLDLMRFEHASEVFTRELAALVGVEDLRSTFGLQSLFQALHAEGIVHAVAQLPADYVATRPVHHCGEVDVTIAQRDVGDVRAPDLIATLDVQVPQQVGIRLCPLPGMLRRGFGWRSAFSSVNSFKLAECA